MRNGVEHVFYSGHLSDMQLEVDHYVLSFVQAVFAARGLVSRSVGRFGRKGGSAYRDGKCLTYEWVGPSDLTELRAETRKRFSNSVSRVSVTGAESHTHGRPHRQRRDRCPRHRREERRVSQATHERDLIGQDSSFILELCIDNPHDRRACRNDLKARYRGSPSQTA